MSCNPSIPSMPGCIVRKSRRYDPAAGERPEPTQLPRHTRGEDDEKQRNAPPAVPVCGVQLMGAENMTASEVALSILEQAKQRAAGTGGRPAWDSSWRTETAAGRLLDDLSGVAVCGLQPLSQVRGDGDAGWGGPGTNVVGCGGRIRDVMQSAEPLAPAGEEGKSVLRKLLELQMPGHAGRVDQCGLIRRFDSSGGRLLVSDLEHAKSRVWLASQRLLGGRAVRCLPEGAAGDYPSGMQTMQFAVVDSLAEPILGYIIGDTGDESRARANRARLARVLGFIDAGVRAGEAVLVHCRMGTNRSVTVAAAYLMIYHAMTAQEAVELIQARGFTRYAVRHPGFTLQILALHYHLALARQNAAVHSWSALEATGDSRGAAEARAVEVLQGILARENTLPGDAPAHPPSPGAPAGAEAFLRERLAQQRETLRRQARLSQVAGEWKQTRRGQRGLATSVPFASALGMEEIKEASPTSLLTEEDPWLTNEEANLACPARSRTGMGNDCSEAPGEEPSGECEFGEEIGALGQTDVPENRKTAVSQGAETSRGGVKIGRGGLPFEKSKKDPTSMEAAVVDWVSALVEVLEGNIWQSKVLVLEPIKCASGRGGGGFLLGVVGVAGSRDQPSLDRVPLEFSVDLDCSTEVGAVGEREFLVRAELRQIRVSLDSSAERDRLVEIIQRMAARTPRGIDVCNDQPLHALADLDETGKKGGLAQVAQMMLGKEGEDDEVWI